MSGHGGPRHALDPNPKHHNAGEDAGDRHVREQELRDQNDPAERARRLRDYHMRSGRCLYAQSDPAPSLAAPSSSRILDSAVDTISNMIAIAQSVSDLETVLEVLPLIVGTTTAGEPRGVLSSPNIRSVEVAPALTASSVPASSTTSCPTVVTNGSSGTARTGSPCVHHVMRAKRQLKTEALEINHAAPIDWPWGELRTLQSIVDSLCKAVRSRGLSTHNNDVDCTLSAGYCVHERDGRVCRIPNGSYTYVIRINGGARDDGPLAGLR